jgi:hypothetical protein
MTSADADITEGHYGALQNWIKMARLGKAEIDEFIERFDVAAGVRLLLSIGFPRGQIPVANDGRDFWTTVAKLIDDGVIKGPEPLVEAAIARLPFNRVFERWQEQLPRNAPTITIESGRWSSMEQRAALLARLEKLTETELDRVLFLIRMPPAAQPSMYLTLGQRKIATVRWAESRGPEGLDDLDGSIS